MNNPVIYRKITVVLMVFSCDWNGIDPIYLNLT
jgi:hypothetical protein